MPLIYQYRIYRGDLQKNPSVLYVFGDNCIRQGLGGQAGHMRGEPNAVGVATKRTPGTSPEAFFDDLNLETWKKVIAQDLVPVMQKLKSGGTVIWPSDGIGTGLSELPEKAPELWRWMEQIRIHLETL